MVTELYYDWHSYCYITAPFSIAKHALHVSNEFKFYVEISNLSLDAIQNNVRVSVPVRKCE